MDRIDIHGGTALVVRDPNWGHHIYLFQPAAGPFTEVGCYDTEDADALSIEQSLEVLPVE
jgi:hypothetical protein